MITQNKKAFFNYTIIEQFEAGFDKRNTEKKRDGDREIARTIKNF